jgi:prepilin peptidase CpaA
MHSLAWWPSLIVLAIATVTDLRSRRIPNWLVLPFMVTGMVAATWTHGWHGLVLSLAGFALGATMFGVLCWMGGMGMGDVKLLAAIGAWIGPRQLLTAVVMISLAGGLLALIWVLRKGVAGEALNRTGELLCTAGRGGRSSHGESKLANPQSLTMPYAPAIALGTLLSFFAR